MNIKTSELTGAALDWAVAKALRPEWGGNVNADWASTSRWHPSTDWAQGGPIIEREGIYLWRPYGVNGAWSAKKDDWSNERVIHADTPLIAAMRCFVASKLGDTVDIPQELIGA